MHLLILHNHSFNDYFVYTLNIYNVMSVSLTEAEKLHINNFMLIIITQNSLILNHFYPLPVNDFLIIISLFSPLSMYPPYFNVLNLLFTTDGDKPHIEPILL